MRPITKPVAGAFPDYAMIYLNLVPDDGLVLHHLEQNFITTWALIRSLPDERLYHRYAPNKWTIKEVLVHIIDDERIFAYRALTFARHETQPLPGFDQDDYARYSGANERLLDSIFAEFQAVRQATLALFDGLPDASLQRMGTGSAESLRWTVAALAYHITGHELHHINLLKKHYL